MKYIVTTLIFLAGFAAYGCGIYQFKVPLNQRGFYNPAAICPYCHGSMFFSTGAYVGKNTNDLGMFVTLGHDGDNATHGAWDFTYSNARGNDYDANVFSSRYAWKQRIGFWTLAAGARFSFMKYSMWLITPENIIARSSAPGYNFDAGVMVTNQEGFYAGISVLNVPQNKLNMKFELPGETLVAEIESERAYNAAIGGLVNLNRQFDVMLDASGSVDQTEKTIRPSVIFRYHRKIAFGAAVSAQSGVDPVFEIQGGYTSTSFKWLSGIAFAVNGPVIETGIVLRFGVERWRITPIEGECVSLPIPEPKKTEFSPED